MTKPPPGLQWSPAHGGHWVAASHALCRTIAADPATFSSASAVHVPPSGLYERGIRIFALEYDDPHHREHRQVVRAAVGDRPSSVPTLLIKTQLGTRLAQLDWSGPVDLIAGLADPLPLDVIFALMGADQEFKPEMKALTDALLHRTSPPGVEDPAGRVHEIARTMVERRIAHPRADWISSLAQQGASGEPRSITDCVAAVVSLITGGHHSTSRGLGSLLARVFGEPGLRDRLLKDPQLASAAAEEALRLHTPLPEFSRTATCPVRLGDTEVATAERVNMLYAVANRDPAVFAGPDEFRLNRRRADHLAFGFGPHRCVGIHLARAELVLTLEELLRTAPDIELVEPVRWRGPAEPIEVWVRSKTLRQHSTKTSSN